MSSIMGKRGNAPSPPLQEGWLDAPFRETLLFYGPAKIGKTWCYCSFIHHAIDNNPNTKIALINTDDGFRKTFHAYCITQDIDPAKYAKNMNLYFMTDIRELAPIIQELRKLTNQDWIMYDLASDPWDWGQSEFAKQCAEGLGTSEADWIIKAAKDDKMFGMLDSSKWGYVKNLDKFCTILPALKANVIGVYNEKDVAVAIAKAGKSKNVSGKSKENMLRMWSTIGAKPGGHTASAYKYDTIVYIYGEGDTRKFIVVGDRGLLKAGKSTKYGVDFYSTFTKARQTSNNPLFKPKTISPSTPELAPKPTKTPSKPSMKEVIAAQAAESNEDEEFDWGD